MEPLVSILISLITAYALGEVCRAVKIPRVIGQICAGIVIGVPFIKDLVFTPTGIDLLKILADIGVILMFFFTGLEINFKSFVKNIPAASYISIFNTTIPLVLGFAFSYWFGFSPAVSIIIGVCLSVTATAFAMDMLEEFKMVKTSFGSLVASAGTVDDVYELLLITIVLGVISTTGSAGIAIKQLLLSLVGFAALVLFFRFLLIPFILKMVEREASITSFFTGGLIITLLMAALSKYLGFGAYLGAIASGLIVRQVILKDAGHRPWEAHKISNSIHTISFGFLMPMFFFWIGLSTDVTAIFQHIWFGLGITAIAIFGTVVGTAIGYRMLHGEKKQGWLLGWAMNAKGDTELVLAQLARESGLISPAIFSSLIFMAIISTLVSPIVFRHLLSKSK